MTEAHYQKLVLNEVLKLWYPTHAPRSDNPYYKLFHATKRKAKKLNVPCWRCNVTYEHLNPHFGMASSPANPLAATQLELHHNDIEESFQNAIDVAKWWEASHRSDGEYMVMAFSRVDEWLERNPEFLDLPHDEMFKAYIESEGNLQQLCDRCHRSRDQGIHWIPYPNWRVLAIQRSDVPYHVQQT